MSAFHHPAPSLEARLFFDGSGFFATSADMRGETELLNNAADLIEVVSLVKAQPVRHRGRRQGSRRHDSFERTSDQLHVVTIGALNGERQWNAGSFRQQAALDALLSPVRRVRPGFFEPESGAFVIAPSMDSQDQSIPFSPSYSISPCRQKASNTPASVHSRKRRYAELQVHIPVASSAFHWQPVRSRNRMAFMASRSGVRGLWQPKGCGLRGGSSGSICSHTLSVKRHPSSFVTSPISFSHQCTDGSFIGRNAAY